MGSTKNTVLLLYKLYGLNLNQKKKDGMIKTLNTEWASIIEN